MKWFKHQNNIIQKSEMLNALCIEFGAEGFAFYMRVHELVCANIDGDDDVRIKKSLKELAVNCFTSKQKLKKIIQFCSNFTEFDIELSEKHIEVSIPNMLNLLDNATRNLQANNKKLTNELQADGDKDKTETKTIKNKKKGGVNSDTLASQIYEAYPRKSGRDAALKAIEKHFKYHQPSLLLERTKQYAASPLVKATERQYIPYPVTWFNQERFKDPDDDPKCWDAPERKPGVQSIQQQVAADSPLTLDDF